jgi:apolipoprotein N-acyltransferase
MQHFSMAVLRAVENGMPIIRAANTGISGYISATGRVYGQTPLMATTTTIGQIYPSHDTATVYTTYGDIFAKVCCVLAMMAVVVAGRRKSG